MYKKNLIMIVKFLGNNAIINCVIIEFFSHVSQLILVTTNAFGFELKEPRRSSELDHKFNLYINLLNTSFLDKRIHNKM